MEQTQYSGDPAERADEIGTIEEQAKVLQKRLDEEIAKATEGRSLYEVEAVAKHVADEILEGTGWEYMLLASVGRTQTRAVLTRYDPYKREKASRRAEISLRRQCGRISRSARS